jgi:hypothetical protein
LIREGSDRRTTVDVAAALLVLLVLLPILAVVDCC